MLSLALGLTHFAPSAFNSFSRAHELNPDSAATPVDATDLGTESSSAHTTAISSKESTAFEEAQFEPPTEPRRGKAPVAVSVAGLDCVAEDLSDMDEASIRALFELSEQDIVLEVYARGCPSCSKMAIVFDQMAHALKFSNVRVFKIRDDVAEPIYGREIPATPLILLFPAPAQVPPDAAADAPRTLVAPISYETFLDEQKKEDRGVSAFETWDLWCISGRVSARVCQVMPRCPVMSCMGLLLFLHITRKAPLDLDAVVDRARDSDHVTMRRLSEMTERTMAPVFAKVGVVVEVVARV